MSDTWNVFRWHLYRCLQRFTPIGLRQRIALNRKIKAIRKLVPIFELRAIPTPWRWDIYCRVETLVGIENPSEKTPEEIAKYIRDEIPHGLRRFALHLEEVEVAHV